MPDCSHAYYTFGLLAGFGHLPRHLCSSYTEPRSRMSLHSSLPQRHLGGLAVSTARDLTFGARLGLDVDT